MNLNDTKSTKEEKEKTPKQFLVKNNPDVKLVKHLSDVE